MLIYPFKVISKRVKAINRVIKELRKKESGL